MHIYITDGFFINDATREVFIQKTSKRGNDYYSRITSERKAYRVQKAYEVLLEVTRRGAGEVWWHKEDRWVPVDEIRGDLTLAGKMYAAMDKSDLGPYK